MTRLQPINYVLLVAAVAVVVALIIRHEKEPAGNAGPVSIWEVQSIDTMKYSRDVARQKLNDPTFDATIESQVANIAKTGATHAAIGTPYDPEFIPFLERWVSAARRHGLSVWYRGNVSGWEGFFDYPEISKEQHTEQVRDFILENPDLFLDGDIFDPCPECENGALGDPRFNGDVEGYRKFLITEFNEVADAIEETGKDVSVFYSMNGDVAKLVMDRDTTKALGGTVVIDHYVIDADKMSRDVSELIESSGGKVVLGEFGAPVPDIHGDMTQEEQGKWIDDALLSLSKIRGVAGINYWVGVGGTTGIWGDDGNEKLAVASIRRFYGPMTAQGRVVGDHGRPIRSAKVATPHYETTTDRYGEFKVPLLGQEGIEVSKEGYKTSNASIQPGDKENLVSLQRVDRTFSDKIWDVFRQITD